MDKVKNLLDRYISGNCSPAEKLQVEDWWSTYHTDSNEWQTMDEPGKEQWIHSLFVDINQEIERSKDGRKEKRPVRLMMIKSLAIAASLILLLSTSLLYFKAQHRKAMALSLVQNDRKAGGNKAYLTLANGKRIALTDADNGTVAEESGVEISKTANGQLIYKVTSVANRHPDGGQNTIETPRGGQYQVTLPDGTKVWLNAASSLKYAVDFASSENRRVELNGEAYFEVTKDKTKPFIVSTKQQEIKVLGTHFNVNGYPDEEVLKTTLLEGSVLVHMAGLTDVILKPNQASVLSMAGLKVVPANIKDATAWKDGYFIFREESLDNIMKTISRWYDIEVVFEDDLKDVSFIGVISRSKNISSVLQLLQETGNVHFKMQGRSVIVMK